MNIGDVEVGVEYGAIDAPTKRYSGKLPRQVRCTAVETAEKEVWLGGGFTQHRGTRKQRMVRVVFLDDAQGQPSYYHNDIETAVKGSEKLLEARYLVGKWSELRRDVHARVAAKQAEDSAKTAMEARINALLPKKLKGSWLSIDASGGTKTRVTARLEGDILDTILALAEKGAAQS
jgi:hypothetical protein